MKKVFLSLRDIIAGKMIDALFTWVLNDLVCPSLEWKCAADLLRP
jgi:hypothetical protein